MRGFLLAAIVLLFLIHLLTFSTTCHLSTVCHCPRWWELGRTNCSVGYEDCPNCEDTGLFNRHEQDLCSTYGETEVVRAMSRGLWQAFQGCQSQFSNTLWNCALHEEEIFQPFVCNNVTRETAVVGAFLSAGATHGIASACHRGVIDCPCIAGPSRREGGMTYLHTCNDNVEFAIALLKQFYNIEGSMKEADEVKRVNYGLGYEAVDRTSTYCRCTGLSGSCVLQTCYERAPAVDEIFTQLRRKYEGSLKVKKTSAGLRLAGRPDRSPATGFPVYLDDTPDLCSIQVTTGRQCDPHSSGSDSCNNLCCGNGFEEVHYNITRERCRFVWCCRIQCTPLPPEPATKYRCY